MDNMFYKIYSDLFFLYNTSFSHSFNKNKGWEIKLQKNKFLKRIAKYTVQKIQNRNDKLIIPQNTTNHFLKNRPRVIHVIGKIGGIGGSQKIIFDLVSNLSHKYDMEVVTLTRLMMFEYSGVKIRYFEKKEDFEKYLLDNLPDIIHLHYYGDWYGFHKIIDVILKTPTKVKIIENVNTPIQMYVSPRINQYVHVSKIVYELQKYKKGIVIYPGVDTKEYRPVKHRAPFKTAGFVYRLFKDKIDEKSFEILIEIAKRDNGIKVIVVGYGAFFKTYFNLVRDAGVRSQFEFLGDVKYKQLPSTYKIFSVFLAAVHTESYGLVVPYAMSMNIPIVAMRVGALPELLGKTNFLCNNANEFIDTAVKVLKDVKKAKERSKGGRKRVIDNFSLATMLRQYDKTYRDIIRAR